MTKTSCWRSIGAATAAGLIDAAVQRAEELGIAIVTVILDDSGVLEMMRRMDGAPIENDGEIVGAIGVSGGYYRQDEACVQAALESLVGS